MLTSFLLESVPQARCHCFESVPLENLLSSTRAGKTYLRLHVNRGVKSESRTKTTEVTLMLANAKDPPCSQSVISLCHAGWHLVTMNEFWVIPVYTVLLLFHKPDFRSVNVDTDRCDPLWNTFLHHIKMITIRHWSEKYLLFVSSAGNNTLLLFSWSKL